MARKNNTEELIHCNVCGEDYSPTYRRCPFCGERMDVRPAAEEEDDFNDGYVFDGQALFDDDPEEPAPNKGGKRLAGSAPKKAAPKKSAPAKSSDKHYDAPPAMNWGRVITMAISLVIIIAALIIVFTVIYPKIHNGDNPGNNDVNTPPGTSNVDPAPDNSGDSSTPPTGESTPPVEAPLNGLTLSTYDFTLWYGQNHTIEVTLDPADWDGQLTWSSSNTEYAKVDSNGTVTNVNESSSLRRVVITVSGGGVTQECVVYCRGNGTSSDAGDVNTDEPVNTGSGTSGELTPGSTAYITGASSGLNVRSGPGTTYNILASLVNGNEVKILEDAGSGWYKISFIGSNGVATAGYVKGDYITATKP